jgi:phosphoglycerol transferase MdoB-like AlkP superfamily enzyme
MRAASLFGVLTVAHLLMLSGHSLPLSPWTPAAYFWQDLLIALLFAAIDHWIKRPRLSWILYALVVLYSAINVPIARVLSSPLTWTMMRAARGPLLDSIRYYLTLENIGAIVVVLVAAVVFPLLLNRLKFRFRPPIVLAAIILTALGPIASAHLETSGKHRNAYGVLLPVRIDQQGKGDSRNWRTPPFPSDIKVDTLSPYRSTAKGRNVILIALESTAAQYLGLYGASPDPMPNLNQLAKQSIVFERAYTVYPESIKELLAVLCSQYPAFQTPAESYANVPCPSLAQTLADAGYRTALFHSGRFMYLGMESVIRNRGFQTLEDAGAIGGNVNSSFGVDEPAAVERIFNWIDALPQGQPFFVTYLPVAGHHPYATPTRGPFPGNTEFANYLNALHYGDESLGELFRGLRERNLEDKTLFVVFGDHGEAFGQHEGNLGHSLFIYEENVRVPYLLGLPGIVDEQIRAHHTASLIDTTPTILDLLGLPIPQGQGSSLLESRNNMALFFTDYSLGFLGLIDGCWKYIFEVDSQRSKLYDVCSDPGETKDRSTDDSSRVDHYRKTLNDWISAQALPRPPN